MLALARPRSAERRNLMAWPTPQYSKADVNKAGRILIGKTHNTVSHSWAIEVLSNWRACHGYPINTFKVTLKEKAEKIDSNAIVAQRLKRTPSIIGKLERFENMKLATMQDIGGLRVVLSTLAEVRKLRDSYSKCRFKHELVREKDYIATPKSDGYRSIHLVYKYVNDAAPDYNGLQLELQFRTKLQHAWATAVETMSTFLGQALKARQGEQQWLQFFEVTGAAFAHLEKSPLVPGYDDLTRDETFHRVLSAEKTLGVLDKLRGFTVAMPHITGQKGTYHLLALDSIKKAVSLASYSRRDLQKAMDAYATAEARATAGEPIEVVLVSAGPVDMLRRAYPNYFLDTREFVGQVEFIIGEVSDWRASTLPGS